jgi:hypothetical protein
MGLGILSIKLLLGADECMMSYLAHEVSPSRWSNVIFKKLKAPFTPGGRWKLKVKALGGVVSAEAAE